MPNEGQLWDTRPLIVAAAYIVGCTLLADVVNRVVHEPYLDEVFHIPQAQQYCNGLYTAYHPKLTTPPGLYYISVALAHIAHRFRSLLPSKAVDTFPPCQTTLQLRYACLLALLALPWVFASYKNGQDYKSDSDRMMQAAVVKGGIVPISPMEALTIAEADPSQSARMARNAVAIRQERGIARRQRGVLGSLTTELDDFQITAEVFTISLLPPLHFFGYLYYTDVPSTLIVMAMLSASRRGKDWTAALIGCLSLTLRQTNVVWILFSFGLSLLGRLELVGLTRAPLSLSGFSEQMQLALKLPPSKTFAAILQATVQYLPVAILSVMFIVRNGSIVLGDKENHQVATHWAQPLYCIAMMTLFAWPALLASLSEIEASKLRKSIVAPSTIALGFLSLLAIHFGTVTHPFMLADNRHYTFYLWRRILNCTAWARYALAPFYTVMIRLWWIALAQHNDLFWLLGLSLCTCAAIIPSPLIEPRYYLIPYLIARLHLFPSSSRRQRILLNGSRQSATQKSTNYSTMLMIECLWSFLINAVTMYLFLYKPFRWLDSSDWQRFMW